MNARSRREQLGADPVLRLYYDRARASLGLAINPDMPIEFEAVPAGAEGSQATVARWVTSDGKPYYTTAAAARAQAELDVKIESMTLTNRERRVVPPDVIKSVVEDTRSLPERVSAALKDQKRVMSKEMVELQQKLDSYVEAMRDRERRVIPARPFVAPGTYTRELDESLRREIARSELVGQSSSNSTVKMYTTYQPPIVAVGDDFTPLAQDELGASRQRKLDVKVEPGAVKLYTQSVESKRRVKLKPRGGA